MKHSAILLALAATASLAAAQAAHKPATASKATAAHATAARKATTPGTAAPALPPGVAPVAAPVQTAFALRYQEIALGTGPVAEAHKFYRVAYSGWLASDGRKFDASADHPESPVIGRDLQPEKKPDGSTKTAAGQPILFPQGYGQVISGWDQGFEGMRVGGKRRLFIPWQLAYGAAGRPTGDPKNPGIPAKADLIFDIELVDVVDLPTRPAAEPPAAKPAASGAKPAEAGKPESK